MFDDIGGKIKILAKVLTWIGIAASVVMVFVLRTDDSSLGLVIIIAGSLFSWIGSFLLYGFGELIQNTDILVGKKYPGSDSSLKTYTGTSGLTKNIQHEETVTIRCPLCSALMNYDKRDFVNNDLFVCSSCNKTFNTDDMK